MKSFMYLITLILSLIFVSASTEDDCLTPIFSIGPNTLFYRSLDHVESASVDEKLNFLPNETMMIYLLAATKELAELRSTECQEEFRNVSLRPAHIRIGANNFTFRDIFWTDFGEPREPNLGVNLTAQLGAGKNPKAATITYAGAYPDYIVIDGIAKFLREDFTYTPNRYKFKIVLKEPLLNYEYHREVAKSGKIITRTVKESLKFSALDLQIFGSVPRDGSITPDTLYQKVAESWLLPIARRIHDRTVKPRVLNLSKTFFQPYKNALLKNMSSEILDIVLETRLSLFIDEFFKNNTDKSNDVRKYGNFVFKNFEQFKDNCVAESRSWLYRQGLCAQDDLYMHSFNFIYDIRRQKSRNVTYPSISWMSQRNLEPDAYGDRSLRQFSSFHRQWIVEFVLVTDNNGFLKMLNRVDVFFFFDSPVSAKVSVNLSRSVQMVVENRILGRFAKKK